MSDELRQRVIELTAEVLGEPSGSISADTTPADVESWDSLAQLNLMVALEDEFAIEMVPEDVEAMTSVGAIVALVSARVG